jgi:hypothetical protein
MGCVELCGEATFNSSLRRPKEVTRNPVFPPFLQKKDRLCLSFFSNFNRQTRTAKNSNRQKVGFHFWA